MTLLIHVDTNVAMYVWGRDHPLRGPCLSIFELVARQPRTFFTDAEVLQELLHRYKAIHIWDSVRDDFSDFVDLMTDRIEPMLSRDVVLAAQLADRYPALSARDLIHVAIAMRASATHIVSADAAFDVVDEIERLDPMLVDNWRAELQLGA